MTLRKKPIHNSAKYILVKDVIDGSVVNGKREAKRFSFFLIDPSGYKEVCERETVHYKKNKQICLE